MTKSRFTGAGSLWKTSWHRRTPYSEIPFITGFNTGAGAQFYEADPDPIILDEVNGWILGLIVGLEAPPNPSPGTLAQSGDVNEGWILDLLDSSTPTESRVSLRFRVFDGAVVTAEIVANPMSLANIDPLAGDPCPVFFPVIAGFVGTAAFGANGAIFTVQPSVVAGKSGQGQYSGLAALANPYVNANPVLRVGVDGAAAAAPLRPPSSIHGLVGGTATWPADPTQPARDIFEQWYADILATSQIDALPSSALGPTVVANLAGWRAPMPQAANEVAPDPLAAFVAGPANLVYGGAAPFVLRLGSDSPARFFPQNLYFPFGTEAQ